MNCQNCGAQLRQPGPCPHCGFSAPGATKKKRAGGFAIVWVVVFLLSFATTGYLLGLHGELLAALESRPASARVEEPGESRAESEALREESAVSSEQSEPEQPAAEQQQAAEEAPEPEAQQPQADALGGLDATLTQLPEAELEPALCAVNFADALGAYDFERLLAHVHPEHAEKSMVYFEEMGAEHEERIELIKNRYDASFLKTFYVEDVRMEYVDGDYAGVIVFITDSETGGSGFLVELERYGGSWYVVNLL